MSNNNGFLSNYNKGMGNSGEPASEVVIRDADLGYKYEEKSGFHKPEYSGGSDLPPLRRPKLLVPVIAGCAVVIAIVVILLLVLNGGVKVINFVGKPLSDAQLWANANGVMLTTNQVYNDDYAQNTIITQDIPADGTVKKGEFLTLTVSMGHDLSVTLDLPDLMSMTMDQVQSWADTNYMTKVRITSEYSDTVPANNVIRYEVNDNTVTGNKVRRDTPVYVIVSKGPQDLSTVQVTVPDFKTMSVSEAYIFASQNGITLTVQEQYDDFVPKNTVISQSVKAQEKVNKGSEILLIVSMGKKITIPDFSDYSKDQAQSVTASLGIPTTIIEKYSSSKAGAFLSQNIDAGTIYVEGDYLELTYSLGNKIQLTSYVGQTQDDIQIWASGLNQQGANITIKVTTTQSNSPKGTIIYQDIANTMINVKATINITVSLGKIIYVPDFVDEDVPDGMPDAGRGYDTAITREEAMAMCDAAGLIPVFVAEDNADRLPGEVWEQTINGQIVAPGAEVSEGTTITLKYKPSVTAPVPDFVNAVPRYTEAAARAEFGAVFTLVFVEHTEAVAGYNTGEVVYQSIIPGTTVTMGTKLILDLQP